jgi:cytochrome c-type biogenesis protein CcmE
VRWREPGTIPVVTRRRSPARLVLALSVAAVLAVFLLYTSIAGNAAPALAPSELDGRTGKVSLGGKVVGPIRGDQYKGGLRFRLRDITGTSPERVAVLYKGSVSDQFRIGRDVRMEGSLQNGVFVAVPGSLITKCPSKYAPGK